LLIDATGLEGVARKSTTKCWLCKVASALGYNENNGQGKLYERHFAFSITPVIIITALQMGFATFSIVQDGGLRHLLRRYTIWQGGHK